MKEGWGKKKLRDVCELINGRAYSKHELLAEGKCRVLRVGNFFTNDHWYHSDLELEEKKYCDTGDLLYAWSASFGPRIWTGERVIFHYHIWKVLPNSALIDKKFLFMWFLWDTERIKEDQGTGTTMIHVSKGSMEDRDIYLPSLSEQQRIVRILDEAFDSIITAKANAEKNLQNIRALFKNHMHEVFSQCDEWEEQPLSELCDSKRGITYGVIKLGDEVSDGVPCLRTSNVRWLRIETEGMKRIAPTLSAEYSRTILKGGEVLVNVRGTLGGVAVVAKEMAGWNVSREVAMVPIDSSRANPLFISYLIGSGVSQEWLGSVKKGAAYVGINLEDLRLLPVKAPELKKQFEVVQHLESLHAETKRLESIYQHKLSALDALKKSLLHHAFIGKL